MQLYRFTDHRVAPRILNRAFQGVQRLKRKKIIFIEIPYRSLSNDLPMALQFKVIIDLIYFTSGKITSLVK